MTRVITYGTFDLLHYGHIRLLERAKSLGDYLIVGVTGDDFDIKRGKINVTQSLMERVKAVRDTGLADEIIIEEYEGQKIDDIRKYNIDIFTVGSDWVGKFDYLNRYCNVIYLERTKGVSSSEIRELNNNYKLGVVGDSLFINKVLDETEYVNGLQIAGICTQNGQVISHNKNKNAVVSENYQKFLETIDAVYIKSLPQDHYYQVKEALLSGKHVLCELPITLDEQSTKELFEIAKQKQLILMESIKTAYATAFSRLVLMLRGGIIGDIVSVDAVCTSLKYYDGKERTDWEGIYEWGPTALLPIFMILGTDYNMHNMITRYDSQKNHCFTKMDFVYNHAVASAKVGDGIKSEGELVISGTNGYVYVPAPWWKTDYFEIRYENPVDNKRYFYQLEGEGIRYELVAFVKAIEQRKMLSNVDEDVTLHISTIMGQYYNKDNIIII